MSDFYRKLKELKIDKNQDINILLLGETGVGKSTFINSIANYFRFNDFEQAKSEDVLCLIPTVITITDKNYQLKTITFGSDKNEHQKVGAACTQDVKTYVFPIGDRNTKLRLIDSPGMGDPRGIEQDDKNCENILAYLSQLKELHAICFLLKPTTTRKTIFFEYCFQQIMTRLEKSASENIIFIFTNTRGQNYGPGETYACLKMVIDEIAAKPPHVRIPLSKNNVFCLDNEAFRLLVALQNGTEFEEDVQISFSHSWKISAKECWRFIFYIVGNEQRGPLKPHQLCNTVSINDARNIVGQLSRPLAEISQLIQDNITILGRHKENLEISNQNLNELKTKLYLPIMDLKVTELAHPVTVCTSTKCAELIAIEGVHKWHYRQRCHDPCGLTDVTKEVIGETSLMQCAAMGGQRTCRRCGCDYTVHMHVYYMTEPVDAKIVDNNVQTNISKEEEAQYEKQKLIATMDERKNELEKEHEVIMKSVALFAHFLQCNAITPFNDSYKGYIQYLLQSEKRLKSDADSRIIQNLEQLLLQYEEMKATFERSLKQNLMFDGLDNISTVSAQSVTNTIKQLYNLKINGKKIQELLTKQQASRTNVYNKNCKYIYPKTLRPVQSQGTKDKTDHRSSNNVIIKYGSKIWTAFSNVKKLFNNEPANNLISSLSYESNRKRDTVKKGKNENIRSNLDQRTPHSSQSRSKEHLSQKNEFKKDAVLTGKRIFQDGGKQLKQHNSKNVDVKKSGLNQEVFENSEKSGQSSEIQDQPKEDDGILQKTIIQEEANGTDTNDQQAAAEDITELQKEMGILLKIGIEDDSTSAIEESNSMDDNDIDTEKVFKNEECESNQEGFDSKSLDSDCQKSQLKSMIQFIDNLF